MWDTIVIGSGIGGLGAAAALARCGQRVLVLEQHGTAGGLTQTFQRHDWTFATGVHYVSGVGPEPGPGGQFGRLLHWLTGGELAFADCGNPYDIVRLGSFEFGIVHPQAAYRDALQERFPNQYLAIQQWFDDLDAACHAARALIVERGLPGWLAWSLRHWPGSELRRWSERTLAQALTDIANPRLRGVLGARWGDYGAAPHSAPLLEHALVTSAYDGGAFYPVGGPARFAQTLRPAVEAAGGELRLGAEVREIVVAGGQVRGVSFDHGGVRCTESARHVISAMGVRATVDCLDAQAAPAWQASVQALQPGLCGLVLYLGFEGDIAVAGASAANLWLYESDDIGRVWQPESGEDAPGLFVSFPSLKDPAASGLPTGEVLALCDARAFAPWLQLGAGERPAAYREFKARLETRLLAQFQRHFPALAPLLRFHELATPVTQQRYVHSPGGALYGVEMSARRLESPALDVRTPVAGLLLAGQDVSGPGLQAACMSGLLAAAALEPALLRQLAI